MQPRCGALAVALGTLTATWAGCGPAGAKGSSLATLQADCAEGRLWDGNRCHALAPAEQQIERARRALGEFDVERAAAELDGVRERRPLSLEQMIHYYKYRAIAAAYADARDRAIELFDMVLTLDPGHFLRYTLSPKALFAFEQARQRSDDQPSTAVDLRWPAKLKVGRDVPVAVEVIADRKQLASSMSVYVRVKGEPSYQRVDLAAPSRGTTHSLRLPAVESDGPEVLEIYATVRDGEGNEVHRWADKKNPREISLGFERPPRWYQKWWVWAAVAGVVAGTTGASVYLLSREPPDMVSGDFDLVGSD